MQEAEKMESGKMWKLKPYNTQITKFNKYTNRTNIDLCDVHYISSVLLTSIFGLFVSSLHKKRCYTKT